MEDLKSIETSDKDERTCLDFLTMDKSSWTVNDKSDEHKLSYSYIQMNNPLTKSPENKENHLIHYIKKEK